MMVFVVFGKISKFIVKPSKCWQEVAFKAVLERSSLQIFYSKQSLYIP
jgi:hypothetical protein